MSHIIDDFPGSSLSANWAVFNPIAAGTPVSYAVSSDSLGIDINDNTDSVLFAYTGGSLSSFGGVDYIVSTNHSSWTGTPSELYLFSVVVADNITDTEISGYPVHATQLIGFSFHYSYVAGSVTRKWNMSVAGSGGGVAGTEYSTTTMHGYVKLVYNYGQFELRLSTDGVHYTAPVISVDNTTPAFDVSAPAHFYMEAGGAFFDWDPSTHGLLGIGKIDLWDGVADGTGPVYYAPGISGSSKESGAAFSPRT